MSRDYLKEKVIQNIGIKDVLGRYAPRKVGKNGMCCCPIHKEEHPSCKLYDDNTYRCFACGAKGDVIDFAQNILHVNFITALHRLANDFGIDKSDDEFLRQMREKEKRDMERKLRKQAQEKKLQEFNEILINSILSARKEKQEICRLDMISEQQLSKHSLLTDRINYMERIYMLFNDLCLGERKEHFSTLCIKYGKEIELIKKGEWENIEIPYDMTKSNGFVAPKERNVLSEATNFYKESFRNNSTSKLHKYVETVRHFSKETVKTFGIGISMNQTSLITNLFHDGYSCHEMQENGLIFEKDGYMTDCMGNRFTIEIRDNIGRLVGFTGRTTRTTKRFKYLNTPTTKLFQKSKIVFNLDKAKNYIDYSQRPYLIIVEGHCDVISLWQNGIRNVVAIMGTACSNHHARLLKMYTENIVLCLDSDKAGQIATKKSKETLEKNGINVFVAQIEGAKDADELMQKENGKEIFREIIKKSFLKE